MSDSAYLVVVLRKPVADEAQALILYDLVKSRLADQPDVEVSGHFTNRYDVEAPP